MSRPLRVGVNAIFLEPGMGGLETYVLELVRHVLELEHSLELTIVCNARGRELFAAQPWAQRVELLTPRGTRRGLRALYELGPLGFTASRRFDVLHSPALTAPLATRAANVVVLADATWITVPDPGRDQAPTMRLWRLVVPHVARRADRVVAISRASAGDVERHLRVPRDRIDVIHIGYRARPGAGATGEPELRARLGLGDGPIVLNVGVQKVHKNQLRVIAALPAVRDAAPGAVLVLAGARTPYGHELRGEAARLGLEEAVVFTGYLDAADLEGLYAAASVLVFPSLNEGFGLPVLEAMAHGVPVVTSSVSSLPEVAGDAALLVDPGSVEAIAGATSRALTDAGLRESLAAAGLRRCAAFSWEATAQSTLATWRQAVAERSGAGPGAGAEVGERHLGAGRLRRALAHPRVVPLTALLLRARSVRPSAAFVARELSGRRGCFAYRVREHPHMRVAVRHGSADPVTLGEVFHERDYAPPAALGAIEPRQILDLGANVGYFGALALSVWPRASVLAYEPDPRNAAVHLRTIGLNGLGERWTLRRAAATAAEGEVRFRASGNALSQLDPDGELAVPAEDVLPLMAESDLVKIDIEGGEWAILGDPRFAAAPPPVVVLEHHPLGAPGADPARAARERLAAAGLTASASIFQRADGCGMLWAWRP